MVFVCSSIEVINLIGLSVNAEYRQFMHVAVAAIREIFHTPSDAFWTGRAMDLLFNGIEIDCSTKSPLARLVCAEFHSGERKQFKPINDVTFAFSLFDGVCFNVYQYLMNPFSNSIDFRSFSLISVV